MKTADHLFLGKALSDKYMKSCSVLSKKAFILGNIFPDINFFTYLRGVVSRGKVRGHNYESSEKCIRKLTQKIRNKNRFSFWDTSNSANLFITLPTPLLFRIMIALEKI